MQVKTGFTAIPNTKLYFEMAGKGKPLILLHSGIADHRMWVGQRQELSRSCRAVTADFRGYGEQLLLVDYSRITKTFTSSSSILGSVR